MLKGLKSNCPICKKIFISVKRENGVYTTFCSRKCANQRPNSGRYVKVLHQVPCATCGKLITPWKNASSRKKYCSKICYTKVQEQNPNWKGGRTSVIQYLRKTKKYKEFMKWVKKRDNYTCRSCGKVGGILHVHHWFPIRLCPQWILEPNNVSTLCIDCHMAFDTYIRNRYAKKT